MARSTNRDAFQRYREASYLREQNRIRGIVGIASQSSKSAADPERIYREGVRRVLVDSRRKLGSEDRASFTLWVTTLRPHGVARPDRVLAFTPAAPIVRSTRIPFSSELDWVRARLQPHLGELRHFRQLVGRLDEAFWQGEETEVWARLKAIEADFGQSIWSIELGIAFAQLFGGLDSQKSYLKSIKEDWRSGLPAYLAHFVSIRNEDRSTLRLYRDNTRKKIEDTKLFPQAQTYLKYRLVDELSLRDQDLSAVVRSEQLQSVIDIYETVIDLIQRLVRAGRHLRYQDMT